jgi:hypothetical protein
LIDAAFRRSATLRPLARPLFRAFWIAILVSNIGNWMQTVGAQWLLVSRPGASALVALVQTADTLPVMLLALPRGGQKPRFALDHPGTIG